ncbi:MAG: imidazoleglycerol-phosphate dehydratase HisB [Bifidobacteriaceae bacterium]|jgi:imidazoleglycerol-phosphate dehydratase|nr:imidazoleglycerol-phosphate dehydratase HisB [Bifidobacteriaceae bacterium]
MNREATIKRQTSESTVEVSLNLDGTGEAQISTGVGFYDHMLTALARHSLIDLTVQAKGDLEIDVHHTVEDTAIVLGQALRQALGDKRGIGRFGEATVPLDESLAQAVVDISGRPYFAASGEPDSLAFALIAGHFTGALAAHVFESIALNAGLTLHLRLLAGRDPHHIVEAEFKAVARALRWAIAPDPGVTGVPSTKGTL